MSSAASLNLGQSQNGVLGNGLSNGFIDYVVFNPLTDDKILDWSKLKQIADFGSKSIYNEKQVPYSVENSVRKGEIASYKHFLLFSQCFPQLKYL